MSRVDERGYVYPTDDDVIPADETRLLLAKAWAEGYEAGTLSQFQEPDNPYLTGHEAP